MNIDPDRLHKLLALTSSSNDSEALTALRRAQALLQAETLRLEDFARREIIVAALAEGVPGEQSSCRIIMLDGVPQLEVRPAAPAIQLPLSAAMHAAARSIAENLDILLNTASDSKSKASVRISVEGDKVRLLGEVSGFEPLEIWAGDKDSAAPLAQTLRRAIAHGLRQS